MFMSTPIRPRVCVGWHTRSPDHCDGRTGQAIWISTSETKRAERRWSGTRC